MAMKKHLYSALIGFIIGIALVGAIFYFAHPEPQPVTVTENPTPEQEKKSEAVIIEKSTGKLAGTAKIAPKKPVEGKYTPATEKPLESACTALQAGDVVKAPVEGVIQTTYTNKKTGEIIGEGSHPVIGETTITVEPDRVVVDTEFTDTAVIALDMPKPPPKKNEVGVAYTGDWAAYYKRDLANIGPVSAWAGASYNFSDNDSTVTVGVAVKW